MGFAEGAAGAASSAHILQQPFMKDFIRTCSDGFAQGWHEANGGNLTYRMTEDEAAGCRPCLAEGGPWVGLGVQVRALRGAFLVVTGAGKHMRNVPIDPAACLGIVEMNDTGDAWRVVWGLEGGGRPTSELPTHVMCHGVRVAATDGADRVVYHAHCPNVIALSTLVEPKERVWTRVLWGSMTECVILFPQGVGVVPWMMPGGVDIARATAELMGRHDAVVWTQHGMLVSGASLDAAFGMMHTIEKAAGLYLSARAANGGKEPGFLIPEERLQEVARAYGKAMPS